MLNEPGVPVMVPHEVLSELGRLSPNDPAALAVLQTEWLRVVPTPPIPVSVQAWNLDAGETAVLALASIQPDSRAILDDLAARRCARALHLPLIGTLGLMLVAKEQGMISAVQPVLDTLRQSGMYVSSALGRHVLDQAGE